MKTFALFVLGILGSVWSAHVLTVLWAWFVVPTFFAPQLTVPVAFGLKVGVSLLRLPSRLSADEGSIEEKLVEVIVFCGFGPVLALGLGWIAKAFI